MVLSRRLLVALLAASPLAAAAEPPAEQGLTLRSDAELAQLVAAAEAQLGDGKFYEGLAKLIEVLDGGDDSAAYYQDANFLTGVALFNLGHYRSSYLYFEKVLDAEPRAARYDDVLPWLVAIHDKVPGETATLERMAEFEAAKYPEDIKDRINLYVGQVHYYQGTPKPALAALTQVSDTDEEVALKARYFEGVVHVRANNAKQASEAFKRILRFKEERGLSTEVGQKVYRMALLSLARIFYTVQKFDTAVKYYDQIPDESDDWLESLLEVSWAHYQTERYGRALGNLHTLNSPYFEEEYFPEARVLEATILYSTCHYSEALDSVDRFIKSYRDLYKELDEQLKVPRDPNQFYGWLARLSKSGSDISPRLRRIFNAALADRNLGRSFGVILYLNSELDALKKLSQNAVLTGFAAQLINEITSFRSLVIGEAGSLARTRLESIRTELRDHITAGLKVRFEALKMQEKGLRDKEQLLDASAVEVGELDREHQYWPFDGEYWKDELDSYTVGIVSICPDRQTRRPKAEEGEKLLQGEDGKSAPDSE